MATELDLAVILTTYQRPAHLQRSLASLALQRGVAGRYEVVVTDDGSQDETPNVVAEFARTADFPVRFTTHPHDGFRPARSRNDGVRESRAEYLVLADGDCVFPPDHLAKHLLARRDGVVRAGWCHRLSREASEAIDQAAIAAEKYRHCTSLYDRWRMGRKWLSEVVYQSFGHPYKPKLTSWNIGVSRHDYEFVNGFDEMFVGWGCEDDDFAMRLRRAGVRVRTPIICGIRSTRPIPANGAKGRTSAC
jgi:glycosyltransferase involved in cell wall biosynthesis